MTANREKSSVAFWATVVLVVGLVGYPLSIGPGIWLARHHAVPSWLDDQLDGFYQPLLQAADFSPRIIDPALGFYLKLWGW